MANEAVVLACVDVKGCFLSASQLEGGGWSEDVLREAAFWVI